MIGQPVSEVDLVFYSLTRLGPSAKGCFTNSIRRVSALVFNEGGAVRS